MNNLQQAQSTNTERQARPQRLRQRQNAEAQPQQSAAKSDSVELSSQAKEAQASSKSQEAQSQGRMTGRISRLSRRANVQNAPIQSTPVQMPNNIIMPKAMGNANPTMNQPGPGIDTGPTLQFSERTAVSFSTKG